MKKLFLFYLMLLCSILTLASCGYTDEAPTGPSTVIPSGDDDNKGDTPLDNTDIEFTVTLMWKGYAFPVSETDDIVVTWKNRTTEVSAKVGTDAVAKTKGLDGEYFVHLSKTPKGYTYDPNATVVNNDNPNAEIELMKLSDVRGKGTDLYGGVATITNITIKDKDNVGEAYSYRCQLSKKGQEVYYEFNPKSPGIYTIESMVDVNVDLVNPIVDIYNGSNSYKLKYKTLDDGGVYKKGGYTKNFKYEVEISEEEIGNVFTFAIHAESKNEEYPIYVDFRITYVSFYESDRTSAEIMLGNEIYAKRDSSGNIIYKTDEYGKKYYELNYVLDLDKSNAFFKGVYAEYDENGNNCHNVPYTNQLVTGIAQDKSETKYKRIRYSKTSDGKYIKDAEGDYVLMPTSTIPSTGTYTDFITYTGFNDGKYRILDGSRVFYNENDGYYHFDSLTGPIVCTKIKSTIPVAKIQLTHVEDPGNSALKVYGKQNYKRFVEAEYADVCNSDGICYVTKELKEFLQKFSDSQCYFFDGNGWCEVDGIFAVQDDQWLFACGVYA